MCYDIFGCWTIDCVIQYLFSKLHILQIYCRFIGFICSLNLYSLSRTSITQHIDLLPNLIATINCYCNSGPFTGFHKRFYSDCQSVFLCRGSMWRRSGEGWGKQQSNELCIHICWNVEHISLLSIWRQAGSHLWSWLWVPERCHQTYCHLSSKSNMES